jgi:hypothetical protein
MGLRKKITPLAPGISCPLNQTTHFLKNKLVLFVEASNPFHVTKLIL